MVKEHRVKEMQERGAKEREQDKGAGEKQVKSIEGEKKKARRVLCSQTGSNDAVSITDSLCTK